MSRKLLVIDDDTDVLKGLTVRLKANGYAVAQAVDGMQAILAARRERPDLILLDIGLPGGDGYSVMERLRSMRPLARIPIVVLTALDPATHQERALQAGAAAFLQKPVENEALLGAIRSALGDLGAPPPAAKARGVG